MHQKFVHSWFGLKTSKLPSCWACSQEIGAPWKGLANPHLPAFISCESGPCASQPRALRPRSAYLDGVRPRPFLSMPHYLGEIRIGAPERFCKMRYKSPLTCVYLM